MGGRRIAVIALSGALVAGGTGAAIAAVGKDDHKKVEQAVLDDAAQRLDVTPQKLRDALAAAQDAQLDQAVKDGKLTQKQADKIKAVRKQSGSVLGGPAGGLRFRGGPRMFGGKEFHGGPGMPGGPKGGMISDLADALGLSTDKLFEQLRSGKSIADVAKAQGKSLDSVRSSVRAATKTRLDKAVKNEDLTQKQADRMLAGLDEALKHLNLKDRPLRLRRDRGFGGKVPPGAPMEVRPGSMMPGDAPPEVAPAPGLFF
jgi:transposase-like protein